MPRAKRGINVLPAPKWTQSDNNLLPKWLKYLRWQRQEYGNDGVRQIRADITSTQENINYYDRRVREYNEMIAAQKRDIAALKTRVEPTDADIMQKYEALIASPHVVGTRIDSQGALVVLIDPQVDGAEGLELGVYELDVCSLVHHRHRIVVMDDERRLLDLLYAVYNYTDGYYGQEHSLFASIGLDRKVTKAVEGYDVLPTVMDFVESIKRMHGYATRNHRRLAKKATTRTQELPWSGFVDNPVRALRRLRLMAFGELDIAQQIKKIEANIRDNETYKKSALADLRSCRAQMRAHEAELARREAAQNANDIDLAEAARSLEFISTLPTVIAIKFDTDGIPVIHVRNTFIRNGKRYDLGDFEIRLVLEHKRFGDVAKVRRTRCPLGGSYEQGWHPGDNAFCFGNRTSEMRDAFYAGDINHAFNLILGTMNEIDADHDYLVREGAFAEIAMDDVWQRKLRRRPRRKAEATPVAATEMADQ